MSFAKISLPIIISGVIRGAVVVSLSVSFMFRDLEYLNNFRDQNGLEATFVYRRVEIEVTLLRLFKSIFKRFLD